MSNPVISVIIPTHNRAAFLERAIHSVLTQRLPCDQLIVVDDGSTDGTPEILQDLGRKESRLEVLRQNNCGVASARNRGIEASHGELIAFLDSDDWWLPDKLRTQVAAMQAQPEYCISHTREIWYRLGLRVNQKKKHDPPHGDVFSSSLPMCVIGMSTVIARPQFFARHGVFDERLPCCEDYDLWLRAAAGQEFFLLVPGRLTAKHGGRPDQLSVIHRMGMDVYRIRSLLRLLESKRLGPEQYQLAVQTLVKKCRIYGQGCQKYGRPEEAEQYLQLAAFWAATNIF